MEEDFAVHLLVGEGQHEDEDCEFEGADGAGGGGWVCEGCVSGSVGGEDKIDGG